MRKKKKLLLGCILMPILTCGIGGILLIPKLKPVLQPNAILEEAKAVGLPITAAELLPSPPIPPEKNAYRAMVELGNLSNEQGTKKELADFVAGESGETPAIKELYENALEIKQYDRFEPLIDRDRPVTASLKAGTIGGLFGLPLKLAVGYRRRRDFAKALAMIHAANHGFDLMADAPDWAIAARVGTYRASILKVQFDLMIEAASEAELELASKFIERVPKEVRFERVLAGLAYDSIAYARNAPDPLGSGGPLRRDGPPKGFTEALLCAEVLEPLITIKKHISESSTHDEWLSQLDTVERSTQGFSFTGMKATKLKILRDIIQRHRAIPTYREMLKVAKRLLVHRNSTGSFPKTLAEIGIELKDVGGKNPVKYKEYLKGFVLYSHGPSEVDEGGPVDGEREKGYDDFGFVFKGPIRRMGASGPGG